LIGSAKQQFGLREQPTVDNSRVWLPKSASEASSLSVLPVQGSSDEAATGQASLGGKLIPHFQQSLMEVEWGPYSNFRHAAYNSMEAAITNRKDASLPNSIALLEAALAVIPPTPVGKVPVSRKKVHRFFQRLLARAPVLIGSDDKPFALMLETLSRPVKGFADSWRMILDAQLVLVLLEHGVEVSLFDLHELAASLYQKDPDGVARVTQLFEILSGSGKISYNAQNAIQLVPLQS
jgi:hypothetical protein